MHFTTRPRPIDHPLTLTDQIKRYASIQLLMQNAKVQPFVAGTDIDRGKIIVAGAVVTIRAFTRTQAHSGMEIDDLEPEPQSSLRSFRMTLPTGPKTAQLQRACIAQAAGAVLRL